MKGIENMTLKKAQALLQVDIKSLSVEDLQKYKVQLLDAWRMAKGDYGYDNDFFVWIGELKSYTPKDYWLLKNINDRLDTLLKG